MVSFESLLLIVHSGFATLSITLDMLLLFIVFRHTPASFAKFGIMIKLHALADLYVALGSSTGMIRIIPIDWTGIAMAYGPCRFLGSTACFFSLTMILGGETCACFTIIASFIFRLMTIRGRAPTTRDVWWLICGLSLPVPVITSVRAERLIRRVDLSIDQALNVLKDIP
ncbi:hypothetical protein PENTCL1PPCAC_24096 [Pristionchus entomophagus]|uniref:G protein-coupled receptor n=1 Tax=Pristionchus entomophagus TaxID=358040 RepID=A0AAV5U5W8_9BILA|nr:hypothetical protein PENTCL1PPCAC_24096 [Pristionchus entomophagus]